MDARTDPEPRPRNVPVPDRGGGVAALEFGPQDRPVDVVFCHANGFNARTYRTILAPLAAELRILAIDLRGHGATTLPADPLGFAGWRVFADDLIALLQAAAERPVVLAGHSLGAVTCLLAACAAPERVRGLVLFEPVMMDRAELSKPLAEHAITLATLRRRDAFRDRAAAVAAYRGRGAFSSWSEAQLADYVAAGFHDGPQGGVTLACRPAWEAAIYGMQNFDAGAELSRLSRPARIFVGETDSSVGAEARRLVVKLGLGLETVAGASHFLPMEHPDRVRQALREAAAGDPGS